MKNTSDEDACEGDQQGAVIDQGNPSDISGGSLSILDELEKEGI